MIPTTTDPNREQRELWNGASGQRWAATWARIDVELAPIQRAVMAFADPRPGERVLDVGCGHGTTSLGLRERVGEAGAVTGVDLSAPLVAVARERTAGTGIEILEADASTHAFSPAFDLLYSRFGVMFFADPVAAFVNLRRALVAGGRTAFVCWRAPELNPWASVPIEAVRALLPPQPPFDPTAPGMWAFADRARTQGILERAGFTDVELVAHDTVMSHGKDLAEATTSSLELGPLARAMASAELDPATRDAIATGVGEALRPYLGPRGVEMPAAVWLVRGKSAALGK